MSSKQDNSSGSGVLHVDARYFLIVLVPMAIFVMEAMISDHMMAAEVQVPVDILKDEDHWLEAAGRYRFLAATWFFASLALLAVCLLAGKLLRPAARETRMAAIATWLVVVALALLPTIMNAFGADGPQVYSRIGSAVFEAALSRGTLPGCAGPDDYWLLGQCGEAPVISMFNRVLDVVNLLAGLGVGALIVGMILCLDTRHCEDIEDEAALLAENLRQMRQQLYLSSVILTFGMFFATSWMNWPMPLIQDAEKGAYEALVLSAALFIGTYFTLLILSFYLPVAIVLGGRVRDLADRAGQGGPTAETRGAEDWMTAHGLKAGVGDYLRAGFALVAPILSAFAGGTSPLPL